MITYRQCLKTVRDTWIGHARLTRLDVSDRILAMYRIKYQSPVNTSAKIYLIIHTELTTSPPGPAGNRSNCTKDDPTIALLQVLQIVIITGSYWWCMYVCMIMYVCMYVCMIMCVCMYCLHACMHVCMYACRCDLFVGVRGRYRHAGRHVGLQTDRQVGR